MRAFSRSVTKFSVVTMLLGGMSSGCAFGRLTPGGAENVFEARFRFVEEMIRLGADARTDGHHAVVRGIPQLSSAPVWSSDIRAGAGLVLAGLVADGDTEVHDVFHIDRGYPKFVENLVSLGAEIERVA